MLYLHVSGLRFKHALVNCFFMLCDFVYYQGGHFVSTDITTCLVIVCVAYQVFVTTTVVQYRSNNIADAFNNTKIGCSQIRACLQSVIPSQGQLGTSI